MEKTVIRIGVISDIVCPWCYVGKRRLEKAMVLTAEMCHFEVEYFPFELNPHVPEEGIDYQAYHSERYGSESRFREVTEHIGRIAASEGLDFHPELQKNYPNTRNIHRIIMLAREYGQQADVIEAFFRAYFIDGVDLTNLDNLIAIAAGGGMDTYMVELLLYSNTGKLEIEMAEKGLEDLGITAVPLYIIDDRKTIAGAQSIETFSRAFEEVALARTEWT